MYCRVCACKCVCVCACKCVVCVSFPVMKNLNRCCALKINSFELFQVSEETQDNITL